MPNWCANRIMISGDPARISQLASALKEGKFCSAVIPVPEDLHREGSSTFGGDQAELHEQVRQENLERHGFSNWYDFCTNRWGTKWEVQADEVDLSEDGTELSAYFESAWAPPLGVAEELYEQELSVTLDYYEAGMGFVGQWRDGVDTCHQLDGLESSSVRMVIGDEMDDMWGISDNMAMWEEEQEQEELTEWIKDGVQQRRELLDATQV